MSTDANWIAPTPSSVVRHEETIDWDGLPYGKKSDSEIAKMLDVPTREVAKNRRLRISRIEWDRQPFGKMPDSELAERLGVSESVVAKRRRARKIPSWQSQHPEELGRTPIVANWDEQPLGQLPDTELARRLGVSRSAVYIQRRNRKIPAYRARRCAESLSF